MLITKASSQKKWLVKKINEITFFQEGPGVRKHQYRSEGVKLINVANLKDGNLDISTSSRYISAEEAGGKYNHFLVDEGDLIIASSGIKVDYFDKKMGFARKEHLPLCMNTSTIRFKTRNTNELDICYFAYFLKTNYFKKQIAKLITGSAQLNFGPSHLKQVEVLVPPLQAQKKIVEVLDKAQALIGARKEQIKLMDELIQAVFYDMFGDPVTNPMGWEVDYVKNVCEKIVGGGTPSKSKPEYYIGNIPWVTPKDMKTRNIIDSKDHINELAIKNSSTNLITEGSILMVIRSGILKRYLPVAFNKVKVTINQDMKAFFLDEKLVNNYFFLYFWISSEKFILSKVRAVTADNIEFKQIKEMKIILPMLELQNQFARKVKKIELQKDLMQQSLTEMEYNFNSLMQRGFKGEL
ncbi:MAG: restriction endonuclease subunit S [Alkaliphilus sp.]